MHQNYQQDGLPVESRRLEVRSLVWPVAPTTFARHLSNRDGATGCGGCRGCGGAQELSGGTEWVCRVCGLVDRFAEPGLSPRERYAARRRLDELRSGPGDDVSAA